MAGDGDFPVILDGVVQRPVVDLRVRAANAAAYSAEQAASQAAFQTQQAELRQKLAEERNRYWTGQEPAKTQQDPVQGAPVVPVVGRGQRAEVISHGAQVDISQHLAPGNVTIVDFYADRSGPCRQISPGLEQMARTDPEIALRKIDIVIFTVVADGLSERLWALISTRLSGT
jgi:thiol-disulfide isomerase/thioredoxin